MTFVDFLLIWNTGRTARNTRRTAEIATWTEEMKSAYWVEQARLRAQQAEQRRLRTDPYYRWGLRSKAIANDNNGDPQ